MRCTLHPVVHSVLLFCLISPVRSEYHLRSADPGRSLKGNTTEEWDVQNNIVGGVPALPDDYPFFVLFDNGLCGGTLIAPNRVLTSATCILEYFPTRVIVGASKKNGTGVTAHVQCGNIHPWYSKVGNNVRNDVGVLKLLDSVDDVTPVTLNSDNSIPRSGEFVIGMGFGSTTISGGPLSDTLQVASYTTLTTENCKLLYSDQESFFFVNQNMHMCALRNNVGICSGDRGGPLLGFTGSEQVQVGVTSFSLGECGSATRPDVYSRVSYHLGWILNQITDEGCYDTAVLTKSPTKAPTVPTTTEPDDIDNDIEDDDTSYRGILDFVLDWVFNFIY